MPVLIYSGGMKLVGKSGVGMAVRHQQEALRRAGIQVTDSWREESCVVHINTVFPDSFFAAIRARLSGKKVIYYGHSTMQDFRNSFHGSNFFAPVFRLWIKICYNLGNIIITPTNYSKKLLESYNIKKTIYALSNGINTDFFRPDPEGRRRFREKYNLEDKDKVVISAGHYIERKGILDFLELAKRMPDTTFIWFGYTNTKLIPKKVSYAVDNAPKNVIFPGFVSREELCDAYNGADCFAFLSLEETEGIVVLEGLACGAPTVLRDIPVYDSWIVDGKNAYLGKTIDELEARVRGVLNNTLPNLRLGGLQLANSRSLDKIGAKLVNIYLKEGLAQEADLGLPKRTAKAILED